MSGLPSHQQSITHKPVHSIWVANSDALQSESKQDEQTKTLVSSTGRPLSPSVFLQQQKLRSKHFFLSPQFDTSCLPEPTEMESAGSASGSRQGRSQPTISVAQPSEPERSELGTIVGGAAQSSYTRSHSSRSVSEHINESRSSFGNNATIGSFHSTTQVSASNIKYRFGLH